MPFPLETPRLVIEPLTIDDVDSFVAYRQDPAIARYQSWDETYSTEQAHSLVQSQVGVQFPDKGEWIQLAVRDRKTLELLGDVAVHTVDDSTPAHEIGFTLATQHQGQGFAREAVRRVLALLFDEARSEYVCATADRRNVASISLLGDVGFELEPERTRMEDFKGESVNVDYFQLSRQNFTQKNG